MRQAARIAVALNLARDLVGNRPVVQRVRSFLGDTFEHGGQRWVLEQRAGGFRRAIGIQKIGRHVG